MGVRWKEAVAAAHPGRQEADAGACVCVCRCVCVCVCVALCSASLCIRQGQLLGKELGESEVMVREGTAELKVWRWCCSLGVLCLLTSSLAKHLLSLFSLPPQCGLRGLEGASQPMALLGARGL